MKQIKINPLMLIAAFMLLINSYTMANSPEEKLDNSADKAIELFYKQVKGSQKFLSQVKGYLVFPKITKAGFIFGGSHGEGVMRIDGETRHYYSVTSASVGFQAGAQQNAMVIAFLSESSLNNFVKSNGWEAGVDGSIAFGDWGAGKDISSISYEKPIVGFIYGSKGLMGGISIKGNKFKRIIPQ